MKVFVLGTFMLAGCHEFETVDQESARRCNVSFEEMSQAQTQLMKLPVGSAKTVGRCSMILRGPQVIDFEEKE